MFSESVITAIHLMVSVDATLLSVVARSLAVNVTASVIGCAMGAAGLRLAGRGAFQVPRGRAHRPQHAAGRALGARGPAVLPPALALERVGLTDRTTQPARTLSGGQQQRLALARARVLDPDLLLFASHNLGQIKRLVTRVLYLDGVGRIRGDLPVAEFFDTARLCVVSPEAAMFVKGELG